MVPAAPRSRIRHAGRRVARAQAWTTRFMLMSLRATTQEKLVANQELDLQIASRLALAAMQAGAVGALVALRLVDFGRARAVVGRSVVVMVVAGAAVLVVGPGVHGVCLRRRESHCDRAGEPFDGKRKRVEGAVCGCFATGFGRLC